MTPRAVTSRDNPLLQRVRKLVADPGAYRKLGLVWVEGEHLAAAHAAAGGRAVQAVVSESAWLQPSTAAAVAGAVDLAIVPDRLFADLSSLPSPAGIGLLVPLPDHAVVDPAAASIVLDRVQDAGNVGSILRTAAAMGLRQVLALRGTAGLWSPKVLRAGMGAHFGLRLVEGLQGTSLPEAFDRRLVATSSHAEQVLAQAALPPDAVWVFGHEGQGVQPALLSRCALTVRIPQPGGQESLNVAAAAAICLYEHVRRRDAQ